MNTTVAIDPAFVKLLKALAKKRNKNQKEVLQEIITKEYEEENKKEGTLSDFMAWIETDLKLPKIPGYIPLDPAEEQDIPNTL